MFVFISALISDIYIYIFFVYRVVGRIGIIMICLSSSDSTCQLQYLHQRWYCMFSACLYTENANVKLLLPWWKKVTRQRANVLKDLCRTLYSPAKPHLHPRHGRRPCVSSASLARRLQASRSCRSCGLKRPGLRGQTYVFLYLHMHVNIGVKLGLNKGADLDMKIDTDMDGDIDI